MMEIRIKEEKSMVDGWLEIDITGITFDTYEQLIKFLELFPKIVWQIQRVDVGKFKLVYDSENQETKEQETEQPQQDQEDQEDQEEDNGFLKFDVKRFEEYRGQRMNSKTKETIRALIRLVDRNRAYTIADLMNLLKQNGYSISENTLYNIIDTMFSMGYVDRPRWGLYKFVVSV